MPIYNAEGLPIRLLLQPGQSVADLTAHLKPGQTLRGRISEVLSDGKAVVNFRGISVTAELKGVSLERGEIISVLVQDLKGTPTFRLLTAPAASLSGAATAIEEGVGTLLERLGLPRDTYHATLVRLLEDYGVPPTRQAVVAVKNLAVALPGHLSSPQAAPAALTDSGNPQVLETAVYMHAHDLPANQGVARAAHEYLYGEIRLPALLEQFAALAVSLSPQEGPAGAISSAVSDAVGRALKAIRGLRVTPADARLPGQLRAAVEGMGLAHETRLAQAVAGTLREPSQLQRSRESLKAALLDVRRQVTQAGAAPGASGGHAGLEELRSMVDEMLKVVEALQLGSRSRMDTAVVYVQVPLVMGAELLGGEMQVTWRRGKDGKKREPRTSAHMTLDLETRALGRIQVQMRMLGSGLTLWFHVFDTAVQAFIDQELPELVHRLSSQQFRVDQCTCKVEQEDSTAAPPRSIPPTSSLNLKA